MCYSNVVSPGPGISGLERETKWIDDEVEQRVLALQEMHDWRSVIA